MDIKHASLIAVMLFGGCTVGPDYRRPDVDAPSNWPSTMRGQLPVANTTIVARSASEVTSQPFDGHQWWSVFHDDTLNEMINQATQQNLNLQIAASRIAEARAQRAAAASAELPSASGNAGGFRSKFSENGSFGGANGSAGGSGGTGSAGTASGQSSNSPSNTFQLGFDALWELDLWGKSRRSVEAADANTQAAVEDRNDALVSLTAEITRVYFSLRGAQMQLRITEDNIKAQNDILALTRSRQQAGFTSQTDVLQAQSRVAEGESSLPQIEQTIEQGYNQLALLLSQPPGTLKQQLDHEVALPTLPPQVPAGIPGDLLRRRPDIRRSEAQLHAATAQVGVAVSQLFPSVQLGAVGGLQASRLSDLTDWASRFFLLGTAISIPIFEGGQLKANIRISKEQNKQAVLQYRQTVLSAYHDVDNAILAYGKEQQRTTALNNQVAYAAQAMELAKAQYAKGLASYLDVLEAERNLNQAKLQLAQSSVTTTTDLVALFKALGGGWSVAQPG